MSAGMMSLVYGLSHAASHPWVSAGTIVPLIAAGLLLISFVAIETRTRMPLMPFRIFANRNRSGVYAIMLCVGTAVFAMFFFLSQFLQNILGYSPIKSGLAFLPMVVGIVFGAQVASRMIGRIGIRLPLLVGPAGAVVGLAWLSRLTSTSSYPDVLGPLLCIGLGMGLAFVALTLTAVSGVRDEDAGLASALLNTSQQVGGALGLAVLATVAITATKNKATSLAQASHGHVTMAGVQLATTHGYTTAFLVASGIALVGLVISVTVIRVSGAVPVGGPQTEPSHGLGGELVEGTHSPQLLSTQDD